MIDKNKFNYQAVGKWQTEKYKNRPFIEKEVTNDI